MQIPERFPSENGLFHVTNRGVDRRDIVLDDHDREDMAAFAGPKRNSLRLANLRLRVARQPFPPLPPNAAGQSIDGDARFRERIRDAIQSAA